MLIMRMGMSSTTISEVLRLKYKGKTCDQQLIKLHNWLELAARRENIVHNRRFVETSDVSRISRLPAGESTRVGLAALECLQLALRVHEETGGAFDVTVGELASLLARAAGETPTESAIAGARSRTGMHLVEVMEEHSAVGLRLAGVRIDLGGVGKGYALDRMAELLGEWSIERVLVHSGQSSVVAVGSPPGAEAWPLGIRDPLDEARTLGEFLLGSGRALSGSGRRLHGSHIIDPRTGLPAEGALGAWAAAASAALADALSTAFMVMSVEEIAAYCAEHPDVAAALASECGGRRTLSPVGEGQGWLVAGPA